MTIHSEDEPRDTAGMEYLPIRLDSIGVFECHPLPDGQGEPTQVHVQLQIEGAPDLPLLMRFKGPRTLDKFISALVVHRQNVWPRGEK